MAIQENTIRRFFLDEVPPEALAIEANFAVAKISDVDSEVMIEDMDEDFSVTRNHLLKLCDGGIDHRISPKALATVAFTLLASDRFQFDGGDDVLAEVLSWWSAPEINSPLTPETLLLHRRWISGEPMPSARRSAAAHGQRGHVISRRRKVRVVD